MRGVYLVAAELSRLGFIASPTSRSALAADILITGQDCQRAFSVQVKTNSGGGAGSFWLVGKRTVVSDTHVYVLVNLRSKEDPSQAEYFVVPSRIVKERTVYSKSRMRSGIRYPERTSSTTEINGISSAIRTPE
jgi:hypothetical protein